MLKLIRGESGFCLITYGLTDFILLVNREVVDRQLGYNLIDSRTRGFEITTQALGNGEHGGRLQVSRIGDHSLLAMLNCLLRLAFSERARAENIAGRSLSVPRSHEPDQVIFSSPGLAHRTAHEREVVMRVARVFVARECRFEMVCRRRVFAASIKGQT